LTARAQQPAMPVVGFLHSGMLAENTHLVAGFHRGMEEAGYVDGQNVTIVYRWAEGHYDQLPILAIELVQRHVAVIAAMGGDPSVIPAKAATTSIPIVFDTGTDPVKLGLVSSLNRPGGNLTGVSLLSSPLLTKQLQLVRELLPTATTIGFLVNPGNPNTETRVKEMQEVIDAMGLQLFAQKAISQDEFEAAFATIKHHAGLLIIPADPFFTNWRDQLVALAARYALPTCYPFREYAIAGGLMSYGPSLADSYRLAGIYVGRILKGEKPADLPVQQSTKVEFVINLQTAKTFGLTFPLPLLGRADEVIE
jgi:putative ABC transport system substrate-binding protein